MGHIVVSRLYIMAKLNEIKGACALYTPILTGLFVYALVVVSAPVTFFAILGALSLLSIGCAVSCGRDHYKARQQKRLQTQTDAEWSKAGFDLTESEVTFNLKASPGESVVENSPLIQTLLNLRKHFGNDNDSENLKKKFPTATVAWTANKLEAQSEGSEEIYRLTVKSNEGVATSHSYRMLPK
jgi:hypothetical protein